MPKNLFVFRFLWGILFCLLALKPDPTPAQPTHIRHDTCAETGTTLTAEVSPKTGSHFRDASVTGLITFGISHHCKTLPPVPLKISVSLTAHPKDKNENPLPVFITKLTLASDTNTNTITDKSVYRFNEVYSVEISLDSIQLNGQVVNKLPAWAYLETDLIPERYYDFSPFAGGEIIFNGPRFFNTDCDTSEIKDEIELSWQMCYDDGTNSVCPEEYHLEWTFINDYNEDLNLFILPENLKYDFKNNSTRVTLNDSKYRISTIFSHGYLLYRVRAIGKDMNNPEKIITGRWSILNDNGFVSAVKSKILLTNEHEGNKNWQYAASYSEEGKKKEVINYYDGSLRSRQTVSRVNTDTTAIVTGTIYDSQGRPAITVLPVPVTQNGCGTKSMNGAIKYHARFNRNEKGEPYSRSDYDYYNDTLTSACELKTAGMSPLSGASNYYSPKNPGIDTLSATMDNYIPDAEQYPFSQTEYTADNTGRIRRQSGTGKSLQLNSGHETKYFYGQPEQLELDRMFGSEAGYASHYQKNVTIDPNGITGVNYRDMYGRTIATSLAGTVPADTNSQKILESLASSESAEKKLTIDLFAKDYYGRSQVNAVTLDKDAVVFEKQKVITYESDYTFEYSLDNESLTDSCLKNNICFQCVYNLEIEITNECGEIVTPINGNQPVKKQVGWFDRDSSGQIVFIYDCKDTLKRIKGGSDTTNAVYAQGTKLSFTLHLTPGTYQLKKTLRVHKEARIFYIDKYLEEGKNNCVVPLQTFIDSAMANIDTSDCYIDCETCVKSLGNREDWVSTRKGPIEQYDYLFEECRKPCKEISWCELAYEQMLQDVSPGGQYGYYLVHDTLIAPQYFRLSVFNDTNDLPKNRNNRGTWRSPIAVFETTTQPYYFNEDGSKSIIVVRVINELFFSQDRKRYDVKASKYYYDLKNNLWYVYPEDLFFVKDFIKYWKKSWSLSLVSYHPEYGYYLACREYGKKHTSDEFCTAENAGAFNCPPDEPVSSDEFDALMNKTETFADAKLAGFIDSNNKIVDFSNISASIYDPFMVSNSFFQHIPVTLDFNINNEFYKRVYANYFTIRVKKTCGTEVSDGFRDTCTVAKRFTMAEFSAMTARCATVYGLELPGAECTGFGSVVQGNVALSDSILDKEWKNFKNFYLSEKRRWQNKRADEITLKKFPSYNECIGNQQYQATWLSHKYRAGNSVLDYASDEASHACGIYSWQWYANKQKRFPGETELQKTKEEADYQLYLKTGQCPLAMHLEFLLNALTVRGELSDTGVALRNYYEFTRELYQAVNGDTIGKKYIPYKWDADITFGNEMLISILPENSNVTSCGMTLIKSGITHWTDIKELRSLQFSYRQNGTDYFTVYAMVKDPANPKQLIPKQITGSTCLNISGCNFRYTCDANDFGMDMMNLWNALMRENKFNDCVTDIDTNENLKPFLTPAIYNTLDGSANGVSWCRDISTGDTSPDTTYIIYSVTNPTQRIRIRFTKFSPGNYSVSDLGSRIKTFSDLKGNYDNHFVVKGLDVNGNEVCTIEGEIILEKENKIAGISIGYCGMPENAGCEGLEYEVNRDLTNLLSESLPHYADTLNIDLMTQPAMTRLLRSFITEDSVSSYGISDTSAGIEYLHFTLGENCDLKLYHHIRLNKPYILFTNLVETGKLQVREPRSTDGNYYRFYFIGSFRNPDGIFPVADTIYGESCFPLLSCDECEEICKKCNPFPGTETLLSYYDGLPLCTETEIEFAPFFNSSGCGWKYADGIWYWGDNTASYKHTHTYSDTGNFTVTFLSKAPAKGCYFSVSTSRNFKVVDSVNTEGICGDSLYRASASPYTAIDEECLEAYTRYRNISDTFHLFINNNPEYEMYRPYGIFTDTADFTGENLCYCVDKYASMLTSIMKKLKRPEDYDVWNNYWMLDIAVMCHTDVHEGCVPPAPDTIRLLELPADSLNICVAQKKELAVMYATYRYNQQRDSLTTEIAAKYNQHCVSATENFTAKYEDKEYHYTLYYYDQAGNLIRTVPPEGVETLDISSHDSPLETAIKKDRANNTHLVTTDHRMTTNYEFNSEGSVTKQSLPDHDKINLWEYGKTEGIDKRFIPTSVQFVQNGKGYLSGYIPSPMNTPAGCIYTTSDGGNTWEKVENISGTTINKVQMIDELYGFAVGNEGKILVTYSGGTSWYDMSADVTEDLNDLYFTDLRNGIIVGNRGTILRTNDGGTSFTKANVNVNKINFRSLTFIEGTYYTCGEHVNGTGVIYTSQNGINWTKMKNIGVEDLNTVSYVSPMRGFTAGTDGNLLKTIDGGNTWYMISTNLNNCFRKLYFKNEKEGIAIMEDPANPLVIQKLFATTDSGKTWKKMSDEEFNTFRFYESAKGYAVGKNGMLKRVLLENSYGLMNIPFSGNQDLNGVYFLNKKEGWVSANNKLFYTENADSVTVVWNEHPHSAGVFKKIYFIDRNTGLGLNNAGELHKIIFSDSKKMYEFFKLSGTDVLTDFTTGSARIFLLHNDGRLGYLEKNNLSNSTVINYTIKKAGIPPKEVNEICLPADTLLITVGKAGEILRGKISSNEVSWLNVSNTVKPLPLKDIVAFKKDEITAVGNNGTVLRTTDGSKWKKLSTGVKNDMNAMAHKNQTEGLVCGEKGTVWKFNVNEVKFITGAIETGEEPMQDVVIRDNGKAYIAGDKGEVWYVEDINTQQITAIKSVPEPTEINFKGVSKMTNSQAIIAVGTNGSVYQYNAGSGAKIKEVYPGKINGIHFSDTRSGTAVGDRGLILQTTNGGAAWKQLKRKIISSGTTVPDLHAVWTVSSSKAFIAGCKRFLGKIEGATVNKVFGGGNTVECLKDIYIHKNGTGYIAGENGLCYRTEDGGLSWKLKKDGTDNFNALHVFSDGGMLAAGDAGVVKYFSGTKWHTINSPNSADINFTDIYFHDEKNGYLVGSQGMIFKITVEGKMPQGIQFWQKDKVTELEVDDLSKLDFSVIGFSDRYNGFIAGAEDKKTSKEHYSRIIHDESEIYSGYFWYDRVGRLILSQNTKQYNRQPKRYSYTLYDELGRVIEIGEKIETTDKNSLKFKDIFGTFVSGKYQPTVIDEEKYKTWLSTEIRREVVHTYYDMTKIDRLPIIQENLRNRIASVTIEEKDDANEQTYNHATHYSYDIHGNVRTLIQDNKQLEDGSRESAVKSQRFKRIDYEYDLISGKVNAVHYQDGQPDAFHHKYEYDADNRLTNVWTSRLPTPDSRLLANFYDRDAKYFYYKHGPLARAEIGELKVQGIDYAYTLQGWLKGVNSETGAMNRDIGKDGLSGTVNGGFANDAYGYSLTYYDGDYKPIGVTNSSSHFLADKTNSDLLNSRNDLFNGNISAMVTTITEPATGISKPQGTAYKYDQLNRLVEMKAFQNIDVATNTWGSGTTYNGMYHNKFSYDANGNILYQERADENGVVFDSMQYKYAEVGSKKVQNRLYHVNDGVTLTNKSQEDIDDQLTFYPELQNINQVNNYRYDEIGNLKHDEQEGIDKLEWTVSGKLKSMTRKNNFNKVVDGKTVYPSDMEFQYDATGNRIGKLEKPRDAGGIRPESEWKTTYYVRDASGNVMSVYEQKNANGLAHFTQTEKYMYGSSRLGVDKMPVELIGVVPLDEHRFLHVLGAKNYEMVNHLGNILSVVSDRKVPVVVGGVFDHWKAEVLSATDYYPFGMQMQGRTFNPSEYDHGFQGMHKGNEIKGVGRHYSTEFREYDPLIGRWWSIDPLTKKFAWQSPYVAFDNNPINKVDPSGDESHEGKQRADAATKKVETDTKTYGKGAGQLDCSGATCEISMEVKDDAFKDMKYDEKFSTSLAANQAKHLDETGEFSPDINDAKVGDYIYWTGKSETTLKNIDHTGVISKIENGTIYVGSAEVAEASNKVYDPITKTTKIVPWYGGKKSFKEAKLSTEGTIWQKRDGTGGKKFVGVGRPKPKEETQTP